VNIIMIYEIDDLGLGFVVKRGEMIELELENK
jgi:hypothetical protein